MSEPGTKAYEVHFSRVSPSNMPSVKALLKSSGLEDVTPTPTSWKGNIRGILRATSKADAEQKSREIIQTSEHAIQEVHISELPEEPKTISEQTKRGLSNRR